MPEHNQGEMGGTMRLGLRPSIFEADKNPNQPSILRQLYSRSKYLNNYDSNSYNNCKKFDERHRHRYEVNPDKVSEIEKGNPKYVI